MVKHQSRSNESLPYTRQKFYSKNEQKSNINLGSTFKNESFGMRTIKSKTKHEKSDTDFRI